MFVKRRIEIAIKLAADPQTNQPRVFEATGNDTISLAGFRTRVRIQYAGAAAGCTAQVSIWGLTPSVMNQLSTLGMAIQMVPGGTMTIAAGDEGSPLTTVFIGTIQTAEADYSGAPSVPMNFEVRSGYAAQVAPFPVSSYPGSTAVSVILSSIATKQRWGFENNGITARLSSPYYGGSAMEQVRRIAQDVNIAWGLINNVLCIWPLYGNRQNPNGIPLIAPPPVGEMIGYPKFVRDGILVKTIFDRRITFGTQIKVESSIFTTQVLQRVKNVSSIWTSQKIDYALDAELPRGDWSMTIWAWNQNGGQPPPLPPSGES